MRPFIRFIGIALIATSLSACETTGAEDQKVEVIQPMGEQPLSEVEMQKAYSTAITSSDSSVEIFPLDQDVSALPPVDSAYGAGAMEALLPPAPHLPQGVGRAYGGDNNVMVFSLDNNSAAPFVSAAGIPEMIQTPLDHSQAVIDDMAKIYFEHGQSSLTPAGQKIVASIADQCRGGHCGVVKIDGHASTRAEAKDEIQRRLINLKISMERAMNISRQLIRDGVAAEAIQVTAHGDRIPPMTAPGENSEAVSRRVEIGTTTSHTLY